MIMQYFPVPYEVHYMNVKDKCFINHDTDELMLSIFPSPFILGAQRLISHIGKLVTFYRVGGSIHKIGKFMLCTFN